MTPSTPPPTGKNRRTGKRGNGEGSITQLSDGRWQGRVTLEDGKRNAFYGRARQEAQQKLTAALRDRDRGLPVGLDERQSVAQYLTAWLETARPTIRPTPWRRYHELLTLHIIPVVGRTALPKLTAGQVQALYSHKLADGLSSTTVHHLHAVLHRALAQAERLGLVARNAADQVRGPRMRQSEMHTLDLAQSRELLTAARGERLEALYVLALTTGMREGELLALRWRDVDLEAGALQVLGTLVYLPGEGHHIGPPKTARSRRRIDLDPEAVAALRRHKARQAEERLAAGAVWAHGAVAPDLVFCNEVGGPLDAVGLLRNRFHPLLERAGLPRIRFHDLRHTAATLMLLQGVNPKVVSERLGHVSVAITLDRYSHVLPSMQRDAAEVLGRALFGS